MKYEIIKGSEKDFECAPEWAMYLVKVNRHSAVAWVSGGDDEYQYKYEPDGQYGYPVRGLFINWGWRDGVEIIAERRPITEPVWSGEGLPPVGTKCEIRFMDCWKKIKITGHGAFNILVIIGNSSKEEMIHKDQDFRPIPIRSPEHVARDEAKGIIAELCRSSASNGHSADLIYDAIAAGKIPGVTLAAKPAKQSDSECEHKNTHPTSGGCACNDCGWTSW